MSLVSVRPPVGRSPLEVRCLQPPSDLSEQPQSQQPQQDDEDVQSNAPSSPGSVYGDEDDEPQRQARVSQPHLSASSPAASYPQLRTSTVTELRVTDNSRSHSNPAQRKKGGCKAVQLTVRLPGTGQSYVVSAKCDVRKSFSNRSFSKYYNRGPYAVVPLTPAADVVVVVEEANRGRDGKHFVAMEQGCLAPWVVDAKRRHPLLAFAADAVYKLSVLTKPGAGDAEVDVQCQFAHGSATVSQRSFGTATESRKRAREVQAKTEADDQDDNGEEDQEPAGDAGKRRRLVTADELDRCYSPDSTDSSAVSTPASPASPLSTTDSMDSCPSSPFPSSSGSPSPPASPLLVAFQLDCAGDYLLVGDADVKAALGCVALPMTPFAASPLLVPYAVGGLDGSPWPAAGAWMAGMAGLEDFVLV